MSDCFVCIVDDDESVRESLPDLIRVLGFPARSFPSAEAFLASKSLPRTRCLVLDVAMPGMSGPELQDELQRRGLNIPIVFITAQADASLRPLLLGRGAAAFLRKPFSDTALGEALGRAMQGG